MNTDKTLVRPDARYMLAAGLLGFVLGAFVVGSLGGVQALRSIAPASAANGISGAVDEPSNAVVEVPASTSGKSGVIPSGAPEAKDLEARHLTMPVEGISPDKLIRSFHDARTGGREHEALDILAPRNTPVHAVAQGNVAKLFTSKEGGLTVYQFDDTGKWCYYYAHLDHYAPGLTEGMLLRKGDVLGYVGTTGNAPADTPHLHFAVFRLGPEKKWWQGQAVDPLPLLR